MSVFARIQLRRVSAAGQTLGTFLTSVAVLALLVVTVPAFGQDAFPHGRDVAEWAREKDVVTLALTVALALIAFSGWLIRKMFLAQEHSAALWAQSIAKIDALRAELANRPCVLPTRPILPPLP